MLQNTRNSYGSVAKFFHWGIAVLIISMFIVAYTMIPMAPGNTKLTLYSLHKSTGLLIFSLVLLRLIWRGANPVPLLPPSVPKWQKKASDINVFILYVLMIVFPISGFTFTTMGGNTVNFFDLFTIQPLHTGPSEIAKIARQAHTYAAYGLGGFFTLHVLGAFYHHFIQKDQVLRRMLPW